MARKCREEKEEEEGSGSTAPSGACSQGPQDLPPPGPTVGHLRPELHQGLVIVFRVKNLQVVNGLSFSPSEGTSALSLLTSVFLDSTCRL